MPFKRRFHFGAHPLQPLKSHRNENRLRAMLHQVERLAHPDLVGHRLPAHAG